jgi:hypothetical protein
MFTAARGRELHINRQRAMQLKRVVFVGLPQAHMLASNIDVVHCGNPRSAIFVHANVKLVQITVGKAVELFVANGDVHDLPVRASLSNPVVVHPLSGQPILQSATADLENLVSAAST